MMKDNNVVVIVCSCVRSGAAKRAEIFKPQKLVNGCKKGVINNCWQRIPVTEERPLLQDTH